jgi:uncharacterized RDD family membrane protein YckC
MESTLPMSYAGFWKRFAAFLIDAILLSIVQFFVFMPALAMIGVGAFATAASEDPGSGMGFIMLAIGAYFFAILLNIIISWLYYALMESSERGATLGKLALSIRVTDLQGNRITFGRATGRYFGKIVSSMILMIGYLMAGFTDRKQALHDIMASCLVINK